MLLNRDLNGGEINHLDSDETEIGKVDKFSSKENRPLIGMRKANRLDRLAAQQQMKRGRRRRRRRGGGGEFRNYH